MEVEKALPEGVVPSQIVHVAVIELKIADRTLDELLKTLPSLLLQPPPPLQTHHADLSPVHMLPTTEGKFKRRDSALWAKHHPQDVHPNIARQIGAVMEASAE